MSNSIHVNGDRLITGYRLPSYTLSDKDIRTLKGEAGKSDKSTSHGFWDCVEPDREHCFFLKSGADILYHTIREMAPPAVSVIRVGNAGSEMPFVSLDKVESLRVIARIEDKEKDGPNRLVLRLSEDEEILAGNGFHIEPPVKWEHSGDSSGASTDSSILVHWLMPKGDYERSRARNLHGSAGPPTTVANPQPPQCAVHIQIGIFDRCGRHGTDTDVTGHNDRNGQVSGPDSIATPTKVRVIVTCLEDICPHARVRRALSYDSIVVDLLRVARGYEKQPHVTPDFTKLTGLSAEGKSWGKHATFVIVRINNTAALLYKAGHKCETERAWLLYHKERAAPIIDPGKGKMVGYNTRIGAVVAACASGWDLENGSHLDRYMLEAVRHAIWDQSLYYTAGINKMATSGRLDGFISGKAWKATSGADATMSAECVDIRSFRIDIADAVSRQSQWFITKNSPLSRNRVDRRIVNDSGDFGEIVKKWLCGSENPKDTIPTVSIRKQLLVDRREIEDYLSLRGEMIRYANDRKIEPLKRPLNLAAFGPPGSGKSFGIKQITTEILDFGGYDDPPLEFNLSQFTGLDDYAAAFHQVRDSCLRSKVPIVFFDEFDSSFQGIPFGWLKYFLAPMQDSEFTDKGRKYRLGPCVLVFAGGVNHSFEEFSGRSRNPAFIEAKGPDFMSRLRDHINVRGINMPDEDDHFDQGRYLLRRGTILHGMLCDRLRRRKDEHECSLLHKSVADAFLQIGRFRHGVRSMEAILDMSTLRRGQTLGPSDLPPMEQLDMHVDGREFLDLTRRSAIDS